MPPPALLDLSRIDLNRVIATRDEIYQRLPHRYEFMQLDGIIHMDLERLEAVGYRDIREDEWWVRCHIPGRPIFPGVLMVETAAHLASYVTTEVIKHAGFLGFGGIDATKFREAVAPPARLILVGKGEQIKPRRTICAVQGFVEGRMVFETRITGLAV